MILYIVTKQDSKGNITAVEGAYDTLEDAHTAIIRYERADTIAQPRKYYHIVIEREVNRDYYR